MTPIAMSPEAICDREGVDVVEAVTTHGTLRGVVEGGLRRFRGIRYATAGRWEPPQPVTAWAGVRDALEEGPACPQLEFGLKFLAAPKAPWDMDEDCLFLSVTAPPARHVEPLPVLVWIHGGGYINGCGGADVFEPARLARDTDAIVVGINYRLGAFGFLPLPTIAPANLGLQDMICGLRWVRDHIAAFGGDPSNVTLIGQSAGAHAITHLAVADGTEDLFGRAIMLSPPLGLDGGRSRLTRRLAAEFLTSLPAAARECSPDQVLTAQAQATVRARGAMTAVGMPYAPLPGHWPLPPASEYADRLARRRVDLVIGHTLDELSPFFDKSVALRLAAQTRVLRPLVRALSHVLTRVVFRAPSLRFARKIRDAGGRVFTYRFDWRPRDTPWGACHCIELPFIWATEEFWLDAPMLGGAAWAGIERFGVELRRSWGAFVRTGTPSDGALTTWRPFIGRTPVDTRLTPEGTVGGFRGRRSIVGKVTGLTARATVPTRR